MSAEQLSAKNRPIVARDESGSDYVVIFMEVAESLSSLFRADLTLISSRFDTSKMLGKSLAVTYRPGLGHKKSSSFILNGVVTRITTGPSSKSGTSTEWQIELRPWLSLLGYRTNCRIFQAMDIKKITDAICSEYNQETPLQFKVNDALEPRPFCVQYNETDLAFITRLLSEHGLHYCFSHSEGKHTLVIGSDNQAFESHGQGDLEYAASASNRLTALSLWQPLTDIHLQDAIVHGYSREQAVPVTSRKAKSTSSSGAVATGESHYWDSVQIAQSAADSQALVRITETDCKIVRINSASSLPSLRSGMRFKLSSHPDNKGDSCSAWIPVIQPLSGKSFGACILPRVGQEVVVSFVDGDPNQPLVSGCLYNGKNENRTEISGSDVTITGQSGVSIKSGGSEISLGPDGITIKAPMVTIEANTTLSLKGLTAELKGTTQTALSGLVVDVNANTGLSLKGSAMVMLQGGLTKINQRVIYVCID